MVSLIPFNETHQNSTDDSSSLSKSRDDAKVESRRGNLGWKQFFSSSSSFPWFVSDHFCFFFLSSLFSNLYFSVRSVFFFSLLSIYIIVHFVQRTKKKRNKTHLSKHTVNHYNINQTRGIKKKLNNKPHGFNCQMSRAQLVDKTGKNQTNSRIRRKH